MDDFGIPYPILSLIFPICLIYITLLQEILRFTNIRITSDPDPSFPVCFCAGSHSNLFLKLINFFSAGSSQTLNRSWRGVADLILPILYLKPSITAICWIIWNHSFHSEPLLWLSTFEDSSWHAFLTHWFMWFFTFSIILCGGASYIKSFWLSMVCIATLQPLIFNVSSIF